MGNCSYDIRQEKKKTTEKYMYAVIKTMCNPPKQGSSG